MGVNNSFQSFIRKRGAITAAVTVLLAASAALSVRGGTGTTTYVDYKREFVTCTATGGLAKYPYCNWREPVDDAGSGSMITGIYYSVGKSPAVLGVDFTVGPSATLSGTAVPLLQELLTSSGFVAVNLTGSILINSGSYLRAVTLTPNNSAHTATMMVEYVTRLSK